ncbi:hypothetical protein JOQ06_026360 [Pogonophryne albipinna]|uniref:Uncharacterized protein n=1 Tax=Pogonophryne albipinna TaxID=1090488 RepID=A0AAD6ADP8_9TELE|nr:hypothetical protein JOQ06_026360 [Pogonophryne albipinna]
MGQDPPGVLQGAFWSGMPGMAQGSQRHEPRHLTSALQLSLALTLSRLETHMGLEQGHPAVSELTAISNGARRHRVVCWLPTKWTNFDVQLCRSWGQAAPRAYRDEEAGVASPIGVGNLPLVCLHHGENARKWSSETVPDVDLNGKQVLMERSGRVPDQRGQGPGGTSQRPYVQLSPECDTVASATLSLMNGGGGGWA